MHEWLEAVQKSAKAASPGVPPEELRRAETECGVPLPGELGDLYLAFDGGEFGGDVRLFPLHGEAGAPSVLEKTRLKVVGLPAAGLWRFGLKGTHRHLFAARKSAMVEQGDGGGPLPSWAQALGDEDWIYGTWDGELKQMKLYRSLENMLEVLVPPVEVESFGERTFARAMNAVLEGALSGLEAREESPAAELEYEYDEERPIPPKARVEEEDEEEDEALEEEDEEDSLEAELEDAEEEEAKVLVQAETGPEDVASAAAEAPAPAKKSLEDKPTVLVGELAEARAAAEPVRKAPRSRKAEGGAKKGAEASATASPGLKVVTENAEAAPAKKPVAKTAPEKAPIAKTVPEKKLVAKTVPEKGPIAKTAPEEKLVAKTAPVKGAVSKVSPQKSAAKKATPAAPAKTATAAKAPAKKAATKSAAKKSTAKKAATKSAAKKSTAKKAATKSAAKKTTAKSHVKKSVAKKSTTKLAKSVSKKPASRKSVSKKPASKKSAAKKSAAKKSARGRRG